MHLIRVIHIIRVQHIIHVIHVIHVIQVIQLSTHVAQEIQLMLIRTPSIVKGNKSLNLIGFK